MKEIFSKNLRQARALKGWSQERAAAEIGATRQAYGAWEEARSLPPQRHLIKMVKVFRITDLIGFISNDKFDMKNQAPKAQPVESAPATMIERKYQEADVKVKLAVNILLDMVDLEEGI